MEVKDIVETTIAVTVPVTVVSVATWHAFLKKGIGPKLIQFTGLLMTTSTIIILALKKILDGSTVGTLIGGLIGYLLSGISNHDKKQDGPNA